MSEQSSEHKQEITQPVHWHSLNEFVSGGVFHLDGATAETCSCTNWLMCDWLTWFSTELHKKLTQPKQERALIHKFTSEKNPKQTPAAIYLAGKMSNNTVEQQEFL